MQLAALGAFAPEPAMKVCSSRSTLLSEIAPSYVPGFPPLLQDADNCTLVVIFPRSRRDGGEVDGSTMVDMPFTKAQKIFRTHCPSSDATLQRLEHIESDDESISMEMFQQDIRSRFVEILSDSGLHSSQFASIDRDEDFLKIWLPLDGPVIEYMAEVLKYSMPLRESVYETIEAREPFPGGEPMENADAERVVAFSEFTAAEKSSFQDFRQVDGIRMLHHWLLEWVSLQEMERQGVISCHFPCPNVEELSQIHNAVLAPNKWLKLSFQSSSILLRHYFGEEIAFYGRFVYHFIAGLLVPGVAGLVFVAFHMLVEEPIYDHARSFCCVPLSIWAATFLHTFERKTARVKQLWGVEEREARETPNPDYDPNHTGECGKVLSSLITIIFVMIYVSLISAVLAWQFNQPESKFFYQSSSIIISIVIKAGNFLWTHLAPMVVQLENHRTIKGSDDKLALLLAGVKLFLANFPFFYSCFLTNIAEIKCGDTFDEVAGRVWPGFNESLLDPGVKDALLMYTFQKPPLYRARSKESICVKGCFPVHWQHAHKYSRTNCDYDVVANLLTYFMFLLGIELFFLVLPIVIAHWEIHKEYSRVRNNLGDEDLPAYSVLQLEAKKFKYCFNSWGGDRVNDWLDMAISYSIVACWGCLCPTIAALALIAMYVSLHLRVYRMLYVTRRPVPHASAGLGIWLPIFATINTCAVSCNVGLGAMFFEPMRNFTFGQQLFIFLVAEHALLLLQATVSFFIPAKLPWTPPNSFGNPSQLQEAGVDPRLPGS
ncbi:unnamed protein product [Effrenium voratum]|uniref:Anoctamin transmembrane domain-containing protein n=1 Tax=Effrenium voratum TaxID=2562239 RepID=A0AA36IBR7_9DINO|nr:unnamed protein product [Effrenium voratum]